LYISGKILIIGGGIANFTNVAMVTVIFMQSVMEIALPVKKLSSKN
jgi:hypothetical protein